MFIKIDTYFDGEYWCARGIGEDIFTQGLTYDELLENIKEAVALHFEDEVKQRKTLDILVMSEIEVGNVA